MVQLILSDKNIINGLPKDITLASLRGITSLTADEWNTEIKRLAATGPSNAEGDGEVVVFETEFSSVPSVPKLADWLALKWAPAVLGSYDIAGIRVGARPVYATRVEPLVDGQEELEIVWQELINFEDTVSEGKMNIKVTKEGITATRKLLDGTAGMKLSASKPFPGESVLVRRLADAAAQAVEKGLAVKVSMALATRFFVHAVCERGINGEALIPHPSVRRVFFRLISERWKNPSW